MYYKKPKRLTWGRVVAIIIAVVIGFSFLITSIAPLFGLL